ncbi:autotransporter outer membrane beta-barrel domain-containing protein [Kaistia adipata]|uniref:autotransporter family protein n=1 Tax=Kaistia adipata TaxID=166954 RepID=UPI00055B6F9E|nr:autotransporter outer membrane beta-barrel domain-containing protein [Kaistia adipata]
MTLYSVAGARANGARRVGRVLRSGASHLALGTGLALILGQPAMAASYTAGSEQELRDAVEAANAAGDATSTITLTGSFTVSTASLPTVTKNLTIDTGSYLLTANGDRKLATAAGASLTIVGKTAGTAAYGTGAGRLLVDAAGTVVMSGVTGNYYGGISVEAGTLLINGGSQIEMGNTVLDGSVRLTSDSSSHLIISGAGTEVLARDGTGSLSGDGAEATMTVERGAHYVQGTGGFLIASGSNNRRGTLNVDGDGSLVTMAGLSVTHGLGTINITNGGALETTRAALGGLLQLAQTGTGVVTVSGEGSRWTNSQDFLHYRGTIDVLDGGEISTASMRVAHIANTVASVRIAGTGSAIRTTGSGDIDFGAIGTGTLTLADGGLLSVRDGAGVLKLTGTNAAGKATLNIGGGVGQAATRAGTLEAAGITLGTGSNVINFNHTETGYVFDIPINGSGAVNQLAGHTIFNADQTDFAGLTSVYGGTLSVNGELGGTMEVRGGRLQGIGTVGDTANYAGGVIAPGNSIGMLTIDGDYTGHGGVLEIEAVLGADNSSTDLLYITGDSLIGTGATQVRVVNVGGAGAETTGDGIKIVEVDGVSAADAFVLSGPAIGGAYRYDLFQNGLSDLTNTDGDWYLRADGLAPTPPTYESYPAVMLGLISLPTLQQRVGDRRPDRTNEAADTALWTRIEGAHARVKADSSTTQASYDSDLFQLQVGLDGEVMESASGALVAGLTAQYSRVRADVSSTLGNGSNTTEGYGIGATLTWYGANGVYVDGQAQLAWFDTDLSADGVGKLVDGHDGTGYALSIEAGREFAVKEGWTVTPQAQLAYTSADFDDFVDPYGAAVSLSKGESLEGRVGVALGRDASWQDDSGRAVRTHVYGITSLTYEFLDGATVAVSGLDLVAEPQKFGAEFGVGGTYNWGAEKYALHGEALASTSFDGSYGYKGTVGLTVGF